MWTYTKKGKKTWEWNADNPLRSPLHPMIYEIFYSILKITHLDTAWLVGQGPRYII